MNNDLISRKAAIDALVKAIREDPYYDSNEAINGLGVCDVRVILNDLPASNLPSTKPERIIRCTNCRFFKHNIPCTGGHYNGCEMWLDDGNEIRVMTDDYCSKALPKEGEQE